MEVDIEEILSLEDDVFEKRIKRYSTQELLDTIEKLQKEMASEQENFNRLSAEAADIEDQDSAEYHAASSSLMTSQSRLASLMQRNIKCFAQQTAEDQDSVDEEDLDSKSSQQVESRKQIEEEVKPVIKNVENQNVTHKANGDNAVIIPSQSKAKSDKKSTSAFPWKSGGEKNKNLDNTAKKQVYIEKEVDSNQIIVPNRDTSVFENAYDSVKSSAKDTSKELKPSSSMEPRVVSQTTFSFTNNATSTHQQGNKSPHPSQISSNGNASSQNGNVPHAQATKHKVPSGSSSNGSTTAPLEPKPSSSEPVIRGSDPEPEEEQPRQGILKAMRSRFESMEELDVGSTPQKSYVKSNGYKSSPPTSRSMSASTPPVSKQPSPPQQNSKHNGQQAPVIKSTITPAFTSMGTLDNEQYSSISKVKTGGGGGSWYKKVGDMARDGPGLMMGSSSGYSQQARAPHPGGMKRSQSAYTYGSAPSAEIKVQQPEIRVQNVERAEVRVGQKENGGVDQSSISQSTARITFGYNNNAVKPILKQNGSAKSSPQPPRAAASPQLNASANFQSSVSQQSPINQSRASSSLQDATDSSSERSTNTLFPTNKTPPLTRSQSVSTLIEGDKHMVQAMTLDSQGFTSDDYIQERVTLKHWDPTLLLRDLHQVNLLPDTDDGPSPYINMEGYLEKLPMNKKKATLLKTWKRRYFKAQDGNLYYYEGSAGDDHDEDIFDLSSEMVDKASGYLPLMGGNIDEMDSNMIGIDDGRGRYLLVRSPNAEDHRKWVTSLQSQIINSPKSTYIKPVLKSTPRADRKVVIIDLGSASCRAGILGDKPSLPQVFMPTVVATDKDTGARTFGIEALKSSVRANATISYPIKPSSKVDKFAIDMDLMPVLFDKVFKELSIDPTQYWIMISAPTNMSDKYKASLMDILVDNFHVQGANIINQAMLALYAYGATSGIVVDIGERIEILPVTDGYIVEGGVTRQTYGGNKVMEILNTSFTERKYRFFTDVEHFIVRLAMEKLCFVSGDYYEDLERYAEKPDDYKEAVSLESYELPEGSWTHVTNDLGRFKSPEGLFQQEVWEMDNPALPKLIQKAVQACPMDARREMWRSVYLSGGTTMLSGFVERLQKELEKIVPHSITVEVHASPQRYHAAYIGACSLASMSVFQQSCISAEEWKKQGAPALRKWHMY